MSDLSTERVFKPVLNSRKPEVNSWLFFVIVLVLLIFLPSSGFVRIAGYFLAIFFFLSATMLSIGTWINRNTSLRLSQDQIVFDNGIRRICMEWKSIRRVEVHSRRVNDKIVVKDEANNAFGFDMFNEIFLNDRSGGAVGFEEGEKILNAILEHANFDQSRKQQDEGYYYYEK